MRAEELTGRDVYGAAGEEIGEIDSIVVDRGSKSALAVIGVGGFLGIGERDVAVPLSELRLGEGNRLIADLTKERVSAMQPYNRGTYEAAEAGRPLRDTLGIN